MFLFFSRTEYIPSRAPVKCQLVHAPLCRNVGYNLTFFPNHLGHQTQNDAMWDIMPYFSNTKSLCSPLLTHLICAMHIPPCSPTHRTLQPCRSLCESVKETCASFFKRYNFGLPSNLDCGKLPDEVKNEECFPGPSSPTVMPTTRLSQGGASFQPFRLQYQITNSPFSFPYIYYRSGGEKLFKYQQKLT